MIISAVLPPTGTGEAGRQCDKQQRRAATDHESVFEASRGANDRK